MGTSLTGLTPATTYDALIKVGDNGPLSATAKVLSDGLGNDSVLALSTTSVGIGTNTPGSILDINIPNTVNTDLIRFSNSAGGSGDIAKFQYGPTGEFVLNLLTNASANRPFGILNGNVGIGTSNPTVKLDVLNTLRVQASGQGIFYLSNGVIQHQIAVEADPNNKLAFKWNGTERMALTDNGLTFNGDTAAANALDDYEEGTFTATMTGSISNPTTAVTTTANYTKIGRQVTVSIMFGNVNTTGASGSVRITGLPFSCAIEGTGAVTCELFTLGLTRTSVNSWVGSSSPTTVNLFVSGNDTSFENLGHNPGSGRYLYTSLTYFV